MTHMPLRALLVDVGGTLVNDATWLERDRYETIMVARLREEFGTDQPWFGANTWAEVPPIVARWTRAPAEVDVAKEARRS